MKTVTEMAREAGFNKNELAYLGDNFIRLADLVRADEREQVALDRKAENARELGLDYEPAQQLTDEKGRPLKFWGGKAEQPAQQEPVATVTSETGADISMSWWHEPALPIGTKLYTSPPQREWQGLTDEDDIDWEEGGNLKDLVKAIEAKLKEKNT